MRLDNDASRWLTPTKYELDFEIDLINYGFSGWVKIEVDVSGTPKHAVRLHSKELTYNDESFLTLRDGTQVAATSITPDDGEEIIDVLFPEDTALGSVQSISLRFFGKMTDNLCGLYRSFYTNADGEKRCMAVTQFEATDARRAFPCWDEPNMKAVFELSVQTHADRICVSNTTPVTTTTDVVAGTKKWCFAETEKMSTYLVAVFIGEFDVVTKYTSRGVLTSVYTPLGCSDQGTFAADITARALEFFEEEYDLKFQFGNKCDCLAIDSFAAGAMENSAAISFRSVRILIDPANSSEMSKLSVVRVISHELSHQWFGNLVTMAWWQSLWLNEGFARFTEFLATDHLFPQWNVWFIFVQDVVSQALNLDAMQSTHPVQVDVRTPADITSSFDAISYAKGASIIRMLETHLGHEKFINGIRHYLRKLAFSNAETEELFQAIEEANEGTLPKGSVENFMRAWVFNAGYPVLRVQENGTFEVERFHHNPAHQSADDKVEWIIPVCMSSAGASDRRFTLDAPTVKKELEKEAKMCGDGARWFHFNHGSTGFFRVAYAEPQWALLIAEMARHREKMGSIPTPDPEIVAISAVDRLGLVRDAFCCAASGYQSMRVPLQMAMALLPERIEQHAGVALELVQRLASVATLYRDEDFFSAFADKVLGKCFLPVFEELGWDERERKGEGMAIAKLRAAVLKAMAHLPEAGSVTSRAAELTRAHFNNEKRLSPNLRLAVLLLAAKDTANPRELWQDLVDHFHDEKRMVSITAEEGRDLLCAICAFAKHADLVDDVVNFCTKGTVRNQDIALVVSTTCNASYEAAKKMWASLSSDYVWWWGKFASIGFQWGGLVGGIVRGLRTKSEIAQVQAFFEDKDTGSAARSLATALETVAARVDRIERERDTVVAFLDAL